MERPRDVVEEEPTGRRLSILHVTAPAAMGGLERVVSFLVAGQAAAGHRVHLLAVVVEAVASHPLCDSALRAGADATLLRIPSRAYGRERTAVRRLCQELAVDVVHTHGYRADVVDGSAASGMSIPVVSTVHGFTRAGVRGRLYEMLQRRAYRRFDAVVAVSRAQVDELVRSGADAARVHLVQNAWADPTVPLSRRDARQRLGLEEGPFQIGWVGRVGHEKGLDVLLAAMQRLRVAPVVVSVIGDGPERRTLQQRAASLPGSPMRWHGAVAGAGALMAAFDVFVLSSRSEGVPIVLFEAMAAGTAVVATRVGGVPDVVTDREAILVAPEDPAALAAALERLRADPVGASERASAARKRLETVFAPGPWLARYERIYRSIRRNSD